MLTSWTLAIHWLVSSTWGNCIPHVKGNLHSFFFTFNSGLRWKLSKEWAENQGSAFCWKMDDTLSPKEFSSLNVFKVSNCHSVSIWFHPSYHTGPLPSQTIHMWHFTSTTIPQHFWKTPLLPQDFPSSQNFSRLCTVPPFQKNLSCALQNSGSEVHKKSVLNPTSTMKQMHYWIFFFIYRTLDLCSQSLR